MDKLKCEMQRALIKLSDFKNNIQDEAEAEADRGKRPSSAEAS